MNNEQYNYFQGTSSQTFTGDYTITVEATKDSGASVQTSDSDAPTKASEGHFLGVRFKLDNHTSGELRPGDAFGDHVGLAITDGKTLWDSGSGSFVVDTVNEQAGTPDPEEPIAAGSSVENWAVFDVPLGVTLKGLALWPDSGDGVALGLPPAG